MKLTQICSLKEPVTIGRFKVDIGDAKWLGKENGMNGLIAEELTLDFFQSIYGKEFKHARRTEYDYMFRFHPLENRIVSSRTRQIQFGQTSGKEHWKKICFLQRNSGGYLLNEVTWNCREIILHFIPAYWVKQRKMNSISRQLLFPLAKTVKVTS